MKKTILTIAITAAAFLSACKKEPFKVTNNSQEGKSLSKVNYYSIGTKLDLDKSIVLSVQKSAYIHKIPYATTAFQEAALGFYNKDTEVARSPNGSYKLFYQGDGNLVLSHGSTVLWASNQNDYSLPSTNYYDAAARVSFQEDGNIVCNRVDNTIYWSAGVNGSSNSIWVLQNDGNFVGYTSYNLSSSTVTITGSPFASSDTNGGAMSSYFGTVRVL